MYSLNRATIIGNVTQDPETRTIPSGQTVCNFSVATNRFWTGPDGQKQEASEFHNIVAWRKLAEICSQFLSKGRKVYIEGRLQTRKWTGQDNVQRESTEVVAENMMILDNKHREGGAPGQGGAPGESPAPAPSSGGFTADPNAQPTIKPAPIADDGVVVVDDPTSPEATKGQEKKEEKKVEKPAKDDKKPVEKAKTEKEQLDEVNVEDIPF